MAAPVRCSDRFGPAHSGIFQILTVRSLPDDATRLPSGLNATPVTVSVCPFQATTSLPSAAFQTRTTESVPTEASRLPSGLNDTFQTFSRWPLNVTASLPVSA